MKLKLSWWQRLALRGLLLDGSLEKWLRSRALHLPQAKRVELQARLHMGEAQIEAVEVAVQEEAVREMTAAIG
jgi:hypothetical protein